MKNLKNNILCEIAFQFFMKYSKIKVIKNVKKRYHLHLLFNQLDNAKSYDRSLNLILITNSEWAWTKTARCTIKTKFQTDNASIHDKEKFS